MKAAKHRTTVAHQWFLLAVLALTVPSWVYLRSVFCGGARHVKVSNSMRRWKHLQPSTRISVVFFSTVNPKRDWKAFFREQLDELVESRLPDYASVDIVLSSIDKGVVSKPSQLLLREARKYVRSLIPQATVTLSGENQFEYPGIRHAWKIATTDADPDNHIILYLHGKGMVNSESRQIRPDLNKHLMKYVVMPWPGVVRAFQADPLLQKAGYAIGQRGNVWFNFWWARASYLNLLVEPILTDDRYYYEHWLSFLKPEATAKGEVLVGYQGNTSTCNVVYPAAFRFSGPHHSISLCPGLVWQSDVYLPELLDLIMATCHADIPYDSPKKC